MPQTPQHPTILPNIIGDTTLTACDSTIWQGTYTTSGLYSDNLTAANGILDSIVTLNLTIIQYDSSDTTATACDSLVWRGVKYTGSGTYFDTLQTQTGCDSVVTLNFTVNTPQLLLYQATPLAGINVDSVLLDAGAGYTSYDWNNGTITNKFMLLQMDSIQLQ